MKNIILSSALFMCIVSETFANKDLAIMLDVNKESQKYINRIRTNSKIRKNKYTHHVTIGFIKNSQGLDDNEMKELGESIVETIKQQKLPSLEFTVGEVRENYPKKGYLSFKPSESSESTLKEINEILNNMVRRFGHRCARYTQTNHYIPHMTILTPQQPLKGQDFSNLNNCVSNIAGKINFKDLKLTYCLVSED